MSAKCRTDEPGTARNKDTHSHPLLSQISGDLSLGSAAPRSIRKLRLSAPKAMGCLDRPPTRVPSTNLLSL